MLLSKGQMHHRNKYVILRNLEETSKQRSLLQFAVNVHLGLKQGLEMELKWHQTSLKFKHLQIWEPACSSVAQYPETF